MTRSTTGDDVGGVRSIALAPSRWMWRRKNRKLITLRRNQAGNSQGLIPVSVSYSVRHGRCSCQSWWRGRSFAMHYPAVVQIRPLVRHDPRSTKKAGRHYRSRERRGQNCVGTDLGAARMCRIILAWRSVATRPAVIRRRTKSAVHAGAWLNTERPGNGSAAATAVVRERQADGLRFDNSHVRGVAFPESSAAYNASAWLWQIAERLSNRRSFDGTLRRQKNPSATGQADLMAAPALHWPRASASTWATRHTQRVLRDIRALAQLKEGQR